MVTTASPLLIEVYDKTWTRRGVLGAPTSVQLTVRHNLAGTGTIVVPLSEPRLDDLLTEGAAVVISYVRQTEPLMSGLVTLAQVDQTARTATVTITDDFSLLSRVLAWPVPDAGLTGQGVAEYVLTGPAETVAKTVITANVRRLGLPVAVAPDLGRGAVVTASWRMHPIADRLLPVLDQGGIGLTVRQAPGASVPSGGWRSPGLLVDCYVPRTLPRLLTSDGGTIRSWTYVQKVFTGSRWVLGAQNATPADAATRVWAQDVDDIAESHWGPRSVAEVFIDSGNIGSEIVQSQQQLDTARKDLADAQSKYADRTALDKATADLRAAQITFQAARTPENQDALNTAQTTYNGAIQDVLAAQATLEFDKGQLDTATAATVQAVTTRDTDVSAAFLNARLTQGASVGLAIVLAETSVFRYGDNLRVGDRVRAQVSVGNEVQEQLLEASFSWTRGSKDAGLRVTPVVGEFPDPTRDLGKVIGSLRRQQRDQAVKGS